jgi:tRNA-specific 2-thiouridylase
VTAALLKRAGAHVYGVFIKGWYPPGLPCSWAEDRRDAMRVAARLQLPFETLDASTEYKKSVIDYLIAEYRAGRTPNPDIMCNKDVKFGAFFEFAKRKGADAIVTGHYAQAENGRLLRGIDADKDQSYFLWAISKDALAMTYFPLGGYKKKRGARACSQAHSSRGRKKGQPRHLFPRRRVRG